MSWRLRRLANWVNATTPLGLAVAYLGGATSRRSVRGIHLATGYGLTFPPVDAFTLGSVIISRHSRSWWEGRQRLLAHEERHATQYACCGGLPLLPLYALAMAWSRWRTGDRASANVFEVRAGLLDGGYRPAAPRARSV